MRALTCPGPGCAGYRQPRQYLCSACWRALPNETRGRLARRDPRAWLRLRQLQTALADGTPLGVIRVTR